MGGEMTRTGAKIRRLEEELLEKDKQIEEWRRRWDEKNRELESYNRELVALKELYKERARELRAVMEKLEEVSITDDLTQIFNHRYLISRLHYEFERAKRYGLFISLMMLDIDHFKVYNDNNGHLAGDDALRKVAKLIHGAIRETDIVGRYGGEEFAIILLHADMIQMADVAEMNIRVFIQLSQARTVGVDHIQVVEKSPLDAVQEGDLLFVRRPDRLPPILVMNGKHIFFPAEN